MHHQSEDYNLAVALRQSMTSSLTSWPFYLPLAVLGVSPLVALTCIALNTLYQFWIHTELIGRLGPLEWVLNTPSHHRVHHGINPRYLDKNHAGVFIVWDRLFGTFEPEGERPVYGTTAPLRSFDPIWANVAFFGTLARATAAAGTNLQGRKLGRAGPERAEVILSERLAAWWRDPGYAERRASGGADGRARDGNCCEGPESDRPTVALGDSNVQGRKLGRAGPERAEVLIYDPPTSPGVTAWIAVNFVPVAALTTWVIHVSDATPLAALLAPAAWITLSTVVWGGLLERRPWAWPLEGVRLLLGAALAASFAG